MPGPYALFTSTRQYAEHLEPIWKGFTHHERDEWIKVEAVPSELPSLPIKRHATWITSSAIDYRQVLVTQFENTGKIYMEHGVGLQAHRDRTITEMKQARAILVPNAFTRNGLTKRGLRHVPIHVIGTPKMDKLSVIPKPENDVIAVSFHWSGQLGVTWLRYADELKRLSEKYKILGHGHPRIWSMMKKRWESIGVEPVEHFEDVVRRASVYCCDHSSTLYEWAALDRPVVILHRDNSQQQIQSTGLLYQHYPNIGRFVKRDKMESAIIESLDDPFKHYPDRMEARQDLFPFYGYSTFVAVDTVRGIPWVSTSSL